MATREQDGVPDRERLRATGLMLLTALLWSTGGLGIKLANAAPLTIGGVRALFAAMVMGVATRSALSPAARSSWPVLLRSRYVWGAALAYATMVIAFVFAVKWSSAANAILIQYTGPAYVALLSWPVLRERMRLPDWLAVLGCALGLLVFFSNELDSGTRYGNLLAVLSSVGFGALPIFLKLEQRNHADGAPLQLAAPGLAMTLGNVLAFALCAPFVVLKPPASGTAVLVIALLGIFQIGIPYVLYGLAVPRLRAVESSLLACIEPILAPLWVYLATREAPSQAAVLGGALILASVATQQALRHTRVIASRR